MCILSFLKFENEGYHVFNHEPVGRSLTLLSEGRAKTAIGCCSVYELVYISASQNSLLQKLMLTQ